MKSKIELDIRPKASILKVFSRLNYKPWYAIAEFVDNSTQSFYSNQQLMKFNKIHDITVEIEYDNVLNTLTIQDNAYGMEIEDFKRAILLDSPGEEQNSRNEFGMGLKTAASWFGNKWSITSSQLGSTNEYNAIVDINELDESGSDHIKITNNQVDKFKHGTIIMIEDLTKEINSRGTSKKIKEVLSSMYRRDLQGKKINILYNGEFLYFEEYEELSFRNNRWKKELDFEFKYGNVLHKVTGFVGILEKGSFDKAGFSLFRRNRVVLGGFSTNYKPNYIFGQAQSQVSLKLYGELDLDSFPVNQAKDGFVWDGGLEEIFLEELKSHILDYLKIAVISVKDRVEEESISVSQSKDVEVKVQASLSNISGEITNSEIIEVDNYSPEEKENIRLYEEQQDYNNRIEVEKFDDSTREYSINFNNEVFDLKVSWKNSSNLPLYSYKSDNDGKELRVFININHNFFKPYSNKQDFKVLIEKLIISLVISENLAIRTSDHSQNIKSNQIRTTLNELLKEMEK